MINDPKILQKKARQGKFECFLVGRGGVGKSTTINTFLGQDVAEVGKFTSTTDKIKIYESSANDIPFTLIDTPGLADPDRRDQITIEEIKSQVSYTYDFMWFVTKLDENRLTVDELNTIKNISLLFGEEGWKKAVIVFTHADKVEEHEYQKYIDNRTKIIKEAIENNNIDENIVQKIPFIAVANGKTGDKPKPTPDGKLWLGNLYIGNLQQIEVKGLLPLFMSTVKRLRPEDTANQEILLDAHQEPILLSKSQIHDIEEKLQKDNDLKGIHLVDFIEVFNRENKSKLKELHEKIEELFKEQEIDICSNFVKLYQNFKGAANVEYFIAENLDKAEPVIFHLKPTYPADKIQEKLPQTVIIAYYKSETFRSLATNIVQENGYLKVEIEDILAFLDPNEAQPTENIPDFEIEIIVFAVYCQENN